MIVSIRVFVIVRLLFCTSYQTISPERCIVNFGVNLIFNYIIHLIVCILGSIVNPLLSILRFFDTQSQYITQPFLCFWVNQAYSFKSARYICQFTSLDFLGGFRMISLSPQWRMYFQTSHQKIFGNLTFSPVIHWGTEADVLCRDDNEISKNKRLSLRKTLCLIVYHSAKSKTALEEPAATNNSIFDKIDHLVSAKPDCPIVYTGTNHLTNEINSLSNEKKIVKKVKNVFQLNCKKKQKNQLTRRYRRQTQG